MVKWKRKIHGLFVLLSEVGKVDLEKEVEKYKSGNKASFDKIYFETKNLVQYAIYSIIPNRYIVEDLIQDTFTKVSKIILQYHSNNFCAWIYCIAKNLALDYVKRKKEILVEDLEEVSRVEITHPYLQYAIRHLEELEREIFLMKVLCGHTTKRVSEILDMKPSQVNFYYTQAKQKLKNSLKDDQL